MYLCSRTKILLLLISSAVLYSIVTNNVPEQKFNDVQTDVVCHRIPRPSCTKISDKVHTSSTTKIHIHEGYKFVDRKKVRQLSLYWMTEADDRST